MNTCIFNNDNNVIIKLIHHKYSEGFPDRTNKEVYFRKITTYLINNKIIDNNIIDTGAWIGDNSIPWAMNIKNIVYAIDPSSENCKYINDMKEYNNINNIIILQTALSNNIEHLTTNDDMSHCSFVYNNPGTSGKYKVISTSLDILYKEKKIDNIGYIHLDVEGMEYKVLLGSIEIIKDFRPIIAYEQHIETEDINIIISFLTKNNYKVFLINEILPGCHLDCRNFIAFPLEKYDNSIKEYINNNIRNDLIIEFI